MHKQIHILWEVDMNESKEFLAFSVGEMRIPAKHEDKLVTLEVWANLVAEIKTECHGKFGLCTCS
jgi:hypothetical protein